MPVHPASRSLIVTKLPTLFDILSPSITAGSRCASSKFAMLLSCRRRSRSARVRFHGAETPGRGRRHGCRILRRDSFHAIAEHSMCQPGRPLDLDALKVTAMTARRRLRRLPQHKIERRRACRASIIDSRAGDHLVQRAALPMRHSRGKTEFERHFIACGENSTWSSRDIGKAAGDQLLDEGAHLRDVLGSARLEGRPQARRARRTSR